MNLNPCKLLFIPFLILFNSLQAQITNVLFVGNSYTSVNDLPGMLEACATSTNDLMNCESSTSGGYTLKIHSTYGPTLTKIQSGLYQFVVLQEQSQLPATPDEQVASDVFPYAKRLDSLIHVSNSCTETVFYRTWGYKNGDAVNCPVWPPMCTYESMDSMLALRYKQMAQMNQALLSPVGSVWKALRSIDPGIELYQADESHPSTAGTYAAACTFYAIMLRKDPRLISYNALLDSLTAATIRETASAIVYDHLTEWFVGNYDPKAQFTSTVNQLEVNFVSQSTNADDLLWDFGDGAQGSNGTELHIYAQPGSYEVSLIASRCGMSDTSTISLVVSDSAQASVDLISGSSFLISPNPANAAIHIDTEEPDFSLELIDLQGKVLLSRSHQQAPLSLDLSSYAAGIYHLRLKTVNGLYSSSIFLNP